MVATDIGASGRITPQEDWENGRQGRHPTNRTAIDFATKSPVEKEKARPIVSCCFLMFTVWFSDFPVATTALPMHRATGQQRLSPVAQWQKSPSDWSMAVSFLEC